MTDRESAGAPERGPGRWPESHWRRAAVMNSGIVLRSLEEGSPHAAHAHTLPTLGSVLPTLAFSCHECTSQSMCRWSKP